MKYMIMLYGSQQDYDVLAGKPSDKAPMSADARGVTAPVHARRVQLRNGAPVVTDGPYPETQEVLAGYTIVDCESIDRAITIAAGLVNPDADGEYVDIRPMVDSVAELEI